VRVLGATPNKVGDLYPERDPEFPGGFFCLNCGAILREGLRLPYIIERRPPGRPSRLARANAATETPSPSL